jgi:hypothetical protein
MKPFSDLSEIYNQDRFSDLTISVETFRSERATFHVHKNVISTRCPALEQKHPQAFEEGKIEIKELLTLVEPVDNVCPTLKRV